MFFFVLYIMQNSLIPSLHTDDSSDTLAVTEMVANLEDLMRVLDVRSTHLPIDPDSHQVLDLGLAVYLMCTRYHNNLIRNNSEPFYWED